MLLWGVGEKARKKNFEFCGRQFVMKSLITFPLLLLLDLNTVSTFSLRAIFAPQRGWSSPSHLDSEAAHGFFSGKVKDCATVLGCSSDSSFDTFEPDPMDVSVSFLPTVFTIPKSPGRGNSGDVKKTMKPSALSAGDGGSTQILPLFPLGAAVYPILQPQILNIFEPRYRKMYNDILLSGSRRFVTTMSVPQKRGENQIGSNFAEIGVVWYLEELKEVSELTDDRVKYVCRHFVESRVRIKKVLNPSVWIQGLKGQTQDDYLRVEVEFLEDDENVLDADPVREDEALRAARDEFSKLVDLQHVLEEDVRFTKSLVNSFALNPSPKREEVVSVRARR